MDQRLVLPIRLWKDILGVLSDPVDVACLALSCKSLWTHFNDNDKEYVGRGPSAIDDDDKSSSSSMSPSGDDTHPLSLTLGIYDDQPIVPGFLPVSLTELTFGQFYNQPIQPGTLPPMLITLRFGNSFDREFKAGSLPCTLKTLSLGQQYYKDIQPGSLPNSITTLIILSSVSRPIIEDSLPTSLTSFDYGCRSKQIELPSTTLLLGPSSLPRSLTHLRLGWAFDQNLLNDVFPSRLQSISFGDKFNQPIYFIRLMSSLTSLTFGDSFAQPISRDSFPASLKSLSLGTGFRGPLNEYTIPDSLETLVLGYSITIKDGRDLQNVKNLSLYSLWRLEDINLEGSSVKRLSATYRENTITSKIIQSNRTTTRCGTLLDELSLEYVYSYPGESDKSAIKRGVYSLKTRGSSYTCDELIPITS
ncbi:hypothetical protein SAMD00019534_020780 [Acytostelium subglobosum LB1]|uniref:hypothetical protein n=1 Tax=Acytostelium subglobosum LB1 TaxID=1410327 RepID=UPI000644D116|nr:hypothetical protein SAMD00019534_020780 [Acytostelium subglobosum LB1]GAM18903.1 hypothetical protein SAMD00019534_020780 [Acytostelium subglobosum LB1]|eukprot:XP_012758123.1 hypothetical protein SAMD00019534_020780 [Acytostelium subglobosum LB1]